MSNTSTGHLQLDNGTLYYETSGSGESRVSGETVVLSHAAFLDSRMFDAQFAALSEQYHVIRYDMRGFGQSSAVEAPVCRRDDLRQLLDHLGVEKAHFVGCSNGGTIMLDLALEQPERVLSLTVVGSAPSGFDLQGEPPRYMLEMVEAMQQGDVARANELQIRIWFDGDQREPGDVDSDLRQQALAMNRIPVQQMTFFIADTQPVCPLDPPAANRLHEIECPVLVVAGAVDHAEILRAADMLTEGIPNARKVIIDGTGHVPSFEQPQHFNDLLHTFLRDAQRTAAG